MTWDRRNSVLSKRRIVQAAKGICSRYRIRLVETKKRGRIQYLE